MEPSGKIKLGVLFSQILVEFSTRDPRGHGGDCVPKSTRDAQQPHNIRMIEIMPHFDLPTQVLRDKAKVGVDGSPKQ